MKNNETLQFSYDECQRYLKKMAPTENITIRIEAESVEDDFDDAFNIKFNDNHLHIVGRQARSSLIAVYFFLNHLGARFLSPTQEYIPQVSLAGLNITLDEKADLRHRGVCIEGANSIENILDFIDYLPKIYMNSFFVQFNSPQPFLKRYYEHMNNDLFEPETVDYETMSDLVDQAMAKRGLIHHRVGHGWTSQVLGFDFDLAWDQGYTIDATQKQMVAQLDGKKALYLGSPTMTSLCLHENNVKTRFVQKVLDYAQARKDVDILHIWLSDAFNNVCECEDCVKTTVADQYIEILNMIDGAMTENNLSQKICFLLYQELLWPAEKEKLNNESRFIMMFAPITRPFEISYAQHQAIQKPIPYVRNKISLPNGLEENMSFLKAWQANFSGDQFVYDYPLGRAHYGDLGYLKISDTIAADIPYLKKMNLNGYMSCQELRVSLPHAYPNYVMGHLLWQNDLDEKALRKDYFKHLFGADYQVVLDYYTDLSQFSSPDYFNGKGPRIDQQKAAQFAQLYQVSQSLSLENQQLKRQEQIRYHQMLAEKLAKILWYKAQGLKTAELWLELKTLIQKNEPVYQNLFDVYRFIEIGQNYTQLNQDKA